MYEITKSVTFDSAHQIVGHVDPETGEPGKCSRVHGHTYKATICLRSYKIQDIGFVVDYYWIGKVLKSIIGRWDHQFLNDLPEFRGFNTTAELMARRLFDFFSMEMPDGLAKQFADLQIEIHYVEICETAGTSARYYPNV